MAEAPDDNQDDLEIVPINVNARVDISVLPPNVLAVIFGFFELDTCTLSRVARVCVAWRDIAYQPSLWRCVTFTERSAQSGESWDNPTLFPSLAERAIQCVAPLSARGLDRLIRAGHNFITLEYRDWDVSVETLQIICGNLLHLIIDDCNLLDCRINTITTHLTNLVTFRLARCHWLTDMSCLYISRNLLKLKYLALKECRHITDRGLYYLAGIDRADNVNYAQLTFLTLGFYSRENITELGCYYLSEGLQSLEYLQLDFCDQLYDNGLYHLSKLQNLWNLRLLRCYFFGPVGLAYLIRLNELTHLALVHCDIDDECVAEIAALRIVRLDITGGCMTDVGCEWLARMASLTTLLISGCRITVYGITHFARGVARLHTFAAVCCSFRLAISEISDSMLNLVVLELNQNDASVLGLFFAGVYIRDLRIFYVDGLNLMHEIDELLQSDNLHLSIGYFW